MNKILLAQSAIIMIFISSCQTAKKPKPILPDIPTGRQIVNFNSDWKFAKRNHTGAEASNFDDSQWQAVRLPHDWAISGPFNAKEDGYAGKLPWRGVGWYRKTFTLDKTDSNKRVYFDFDGVMAFPKVYINGKLAGEWDYGYMSFRVDATDYVKFGRKNVIAIRVDTRRHGTRWYPGAGIYRKITMTICEPVHVAHWGMFITTPEISDDSATVKVQTTIENHHKKKSKCNVEVTLLDPDGKQVASGEKNDTVRGGDSRDVEQSFEITNPQRWDITSPKLYKAKIIVRIDDKIVDKDVTTFGIRTFKFTADDGFHLNGRRVQLYGVNLHHDQGPLGAAFYTRAMERQLEIMRDMGVNAIRTSHNPSAPELPDLCDRMGFVVWDECFDKWDDKADRIRGEPPLEEYGEKQIRNFVMRDRNHPCVVVWSIGNEIGNQPRSREGKSPERVKFMSDFVRKYDSTRPVGMACHIPQTAQQSILDSLDLTGWNYNRRYGLYRQRYPDKPIIYSESASALSTRGFYELPLPNSKTQYSKKLQVCSYDLNSARWSDIVDSEFQLMEDDIFVAGEFVWTGFDYLGEPTPFSPQARSSYFGIVDLCGIPKDRFYLYRSYWRPDTTTIHILPHWNWPDRIGKNVLVFMYTNGDSAELFLNGKSLGWRTKIKEITDSSYYAVTYKYRLRWDDVVYEPGELKAVAYKDGKKIGEAIMRTADEPAAIRLTPDRMELSVTGEDLCYILVEALDEKGTLCPLADNLIRFRVEGPAEIAGVGNGNPLSLDPFQADYRKLFYGKAMLIIRTAEGQGGKVRVTAESDGLTSANITVQSRAEENKYSISSPDEKISVSVWISDDKSAFYSIEFSGTAVLQQSKLGLVREDSDFSKELSLESVSDIETVNIDYEMLQGKRRHCSYMGNRQIFYLKNSSGKKMDIIFQVFNDGVACRYYFPEQSQDVKKITKEITSFNFLSGTKAWIQPMTDAKSGWSQVEPCYEQHYRQGIELVKLARNNAGWVFPALFNYDKYWMLISETAPDRNYCGCRLKRDSMGNEFFIGFPQKPEIFPGGPLNPESKLPWYTPWRIIAIGDSLKPIIESTLGTDLAGPCKLQDTSFVKPGRASWSWVMLKDGSVTYDVQKHFIDFAADMKWEYCLVDANWDTQIGYDKIQELAEYARSKNVGLLIWYNSAGDWNTAYYHPKSKLLTHEDRVKEFGKLKEMGIKGIKVDFFGGDGQSMMAYYQDILEDAAKFGLVVNCHGATIPRGWQRTYPNLLTVEAIRGFEHVTFGQFNADLEPTHCCVVPFTRNAFDPMDFTPVCFSEVPNIKRVTTNGFELALSVIFYSGIQHFAQIPEAMAKMPDYVKDFMREIPVCWDDTRFVDGFPGKFVVIARKFNNTWYVAGINGEDTEKSINLELDFLKDIRTAILITDGMDNRSFDMKTITIKLEKPLAIKLKKNGGFVVKAEKI